MSALVRVVDPAGVAAATAAVRARGGRIGFVPTMGALHEGHLGLVDLAAERVGPSGAVVVSVFVNPTQFDDPADLAAYPVDLEADASLLAARAVGVPVVLYAPAVATVHPSYPEPAAVAVTVRGLTDHLDGPHRPGHFDAVATVVTLLIGQVRPDLIVLGRKDFQQLVIVRRAVADLALPVEVVAGRTSRDPDGLARSSRNQRLDAAARARALAVPRALAGLVRAVRAARAAAADGGPVAVAPMLADAVSGLGDAGLEVDYLELVDPDALAPVGRLGGAPALAAVAVRVAVPGGTVRLIDNVVLGDAADEDALLAAVGDTGRG